MGIPWLGHTCGQCRYCKKGQENLCDDALFTGYTMDGGYAEYMIAFEDYCMPLSECFAQPIGAPLLCAGLIGYRSYQMIGKDAINIGIYGFGAAAHILAQIARLEQKRVFAFTRKDDRASQILHWNLAQHGPAIPPKRPLNGWMLPSSSHPLATWFLWLCRK